MLNEYPYSALESAEALSGATSASYSAGTTPGYEAASAKTLAPVEGLALQVTVASVSGGEIDLIVQTAPSEADADGEWVDTTTRINGITANGSYSIEVVSPIMDKVRVAFSPVTSFTGTITPRWLCTQPTGSP